MDDENDRAQRAKRASPFLNTEQAAFYLGLNPRTLQRLRRTAKGPRVRRHASRVRYHIDDLDAWSKNVAPSESNDG